MMNQSWTRVPSILSTVTKTFSTKEERDSVTEFQKELETSDRLGPLESTFTDILTVIDKNIKWREQNEAQIIDWINSNHNSTTDAPPGTTDEPEGTTEEPEGTTEEPQGTDLPVETTESGAIFFGISAIVLSLCML